MLARASAPSPARSLPRARGRAASRTVVRASLSSPLSVDDALAVVIEHARLDSARLHEGVPDDVRRAIDRLIDSGRVDGGIENAVRGDGTWRVFSAPHISRLATPLGVKFHPLRYVIADGDMTSDVRHGGIVPDGWLSASGGVRVTQEYELDGVMRPACRISFDKFWIGPGGDAPREEPGDDDEGFVDKVIDFVGNLGFLETFATFPVLFYDEEVGVVVFQFPPLASNIAAYRESR